MLVYISLILTRLVFLCVQAILEQLLRFLAAPWDLSRELSRCVVVALDVSLEEVLLVSPLVNKQVWDVPGFSDVLLRQLSLASSAASSTAVNAAAGGVQLSSACLCVVSTLFTDPSLATILSRPGNHEFLRRAAYLLSYADTNWQALKFLSECFERSVLAAAVSNSNSVDAVFGLFHKFKSHANSAASLLGITSAPVYNVKLVETAVEALSDLLKSNREILFSPDNVESISQLHGALCAGLSSGQLGVNPDLTALCESLLALAVAIRDKCTAAHAPSSAYITEMVDSLARTWKDKLNEAYAAGFSALLPSDSMGDMEVEGSGAGSDDSLLRALLGTGLKPGDVLIDIAVVPTWEPANLVKRIRVPSSCSLSKLQTALSLELRTEVRLCLDQKTLDGKYVVIGTQHQLEELFREFIGRSGRTPVVVWAEPNQASLFSPEQLGLPSNRSRAFDAIGLQAKGVALRDLQRELEQEGRVINAQLLGDFYEYFHQQGTSEVTVEQFMACMTSSKLGFSPTSARALFHGFDTDNSGTLSLKEIGVGLARLTQGSVDEKLMLMFQAYDTDNNGYLDVTELSNLIHVASGISITEATTYASTVIAAVDKNGDRRLDMFEFRDAAFKQLLPLSLLWSEGKVNNYSGGRDNRRQDDRDSAGNARRPQTDGGYRNQQQQQRNDQRGGGGGGRKRGQSPTGGDSRGRSPTGRGGRRGNSPTWQQRGRGYDDNNLRRPAPRPVAAQRRNSADRQQRPNPFSSR